MQPWRWCGPPMKMSLTPWLKKKKGRAGRGVEWEERSLTLKHVHDLFVCLVSVSSCKPHSSSCPPILFILKLDALSIYCPSPALNLFFTFSFPQDSLLLLSDLLAPFPHGWWPGVGACRQQLPHGVRECSKGDGEQTPAAKGSLSSSHPSLAFSSPSVAQVGRNSSSVHPIGCFPPISFLFSSQPAGDGSRFSCPWSRKGCVGREERIVPQPDYPL